MWAKSLENEMQRGKAFVPQGDIKLPYFLFMNLVLGYTNCEGEKKFSQMPWVFEQKKVLREF